MPMPYGIVAGSNFGVVGDGVTDATAGIQAAIDFASNAKCPLFIPPGRFVLSDEGGGTADDTRALWLRSDVKIMGAGRDVSTLVLSPEQHAHLFEANGAHNFGLSDLTLECNRLSQSGGHGIRIAYDGATNAVFENLRIKGAAGYNFGIQNTTGPCEDILLRNIILEDSGADAIDIKCRMTATDGPANKAIRLEGIRVLSFGKDLSNPTETAVDLRGEIMASDIIVDGVTGDRIGIRFRFGENGDNANGVGAHNSMITNFRVIGDGLGSSVGVDIGARNVNLVNGIITNCGLMGVNILQRENALTNVQTIGCPVGFRMSAGNGLTSDADRTMLTSCFARSASNTGFDMRSDENTLVGCYARSCGTSFRILSGSDNNSIIGGGSSAHTVAALANGGLGTKVRGARGIADMG